MEKAKLLLTNKILCITLLIHNEKITIGDLDNETSNKKTG